VSDLPPPPATSGKPAAKFDFARLSQKDRIVGIASLVLLISLYLDWFGVSVVGVGSSAASGMTAHGYLWIVFILCLVIVGYFVAVALFDKLPFDLPVAAEHLLFGATLINFVLTLIAFVFKPAGFGVAVGYRFGAFIALVASIVALAPLARPVIQKWRSQHA
jgi:hypothetical protein